MKGDQFVKLKVNMNIDEDISTEFRVTFLGQSRIMNEQVKSVVFEFEESGTHNIEISQQVVDERFSVMQRIVYLLFVPLIGILRMFAVFGEKSSSLYNKIHPYLITQSATLRIVGDTEVNVKYIASAYDKKKKNWSRPSLNFSDFSTIGNVVIEKNDKAFDNYYFDFKRTFGALGFDVILFFVIVSLMALNKGQMRAFVAFLVLSVFIFGVCLLVITLTRNKIRKAKTKFNLES